jgi:hypothetical protein
VESIGRERAGSAPPGTRAVDFLALGTLVVTMVRSSEMLRAVVGALQSWLAASRQRSVKLELDGDVLEVTGLSLADQRRLIDNWIARQADGDERERRRGGDRAMDEGRSALIVANDRYQDPRLRRLRTPTRDAEALARVLGDPRSATSGSGW